MKAKITFETITPKQAKSILETSILRYYKIDQDYVNRMVERVKRFNGDKRVGLFLIKNSREYNSGENALATIITTNTNCEVAIVKGIKKTESVLVNYSLGGSATYRIAHDKMKKLKEDAEEIFFEMIPYDRLPQSIVFAMDSNEFSDHITRDILLESADFVFNNAPANTNSGIKLPLPRQVAIHGFLQILIGKDKANSVFEEFYSGRGNLSSFFEKFQAA